MGTKTILIVGLSRAEALKEFESDCNFKNNDKRLHVEDVTETYMKDYLEERVLAYYDGKRCYAFPSQTSEFYKPISSDSEEYKKFFIKNKDKLDKFIPEASLVEAPDYLLNNECDLYKKTSSVKVYLHRIRVSALLTFKEWFLEKYKYETTVKNDLSELQKGCVSGEFYLIENKKDETCRIFVLSGMNKFDYKKDGTNEGVPGKLSISGYEKFVKKYYKEFQEVKKIFFEEYDQNLINSHKLLEDFLLEGKYYTKREAERQYNAQSSIMKFRHFLNNYYEDFKKFSRIPFEYWYQEVKFDDIAVYAFPDVDAVIINSFNDRFLWKANYEKIFMSKYSNDIFLNPYDTEIYYKNDYRWIEYKDMISETMELVYGNVKCKRIWRNFIHYLFMGNGKDKSEIENLGGYFVKVYC